MTPRFRMIAGPNGSGKTTLYERLAGEFAVNFYTMLNADRMFAEASANRTILAPLPIDGADLARHIAASSYPESVLAPFRRGAIILNDGLFRFVDPRAITSYTVSLIVNFIQERMIRSRQSFSQETVFSHPSKIDSLRAAKHLGFRTYLYFVSTEHPQINAFRVRDRVSKGGHDVPVGKIVSRYARALRNIAPALPFLSRAFFFDNSGFEMRYIASYDESSGWTAKVTIPSLPQWFRHAVPTAFPFSKRHPNPDDPK